MPFVGCATPAEPERAIVFYDGGCGFCHRGVVFFMQRDRRDRLRFAPLGGITHHELIPSAVPMSTTDSLLLRTRDGEILDKSRAVRAILSNLSACWPVLALIMGCIPRCAGDIMYDWIARRRQRWFAPPSASCPLVPAQWRERFLP